MSQVCYNKVIIIIIIQKNKLQNLKFKNLKIFYSKIVLQKVSIAVFNRRKQWFKIKHVVLCHLASINYRKSPFKTASARSLSVLSLVILSKWYMTYVFKKLFVFGDPPDNCG